jgi:putative transposase
MSKKNEKKQRRAERWEQFRFGVIGQLLAAPPAKGELQAELEKLAAKKWLLPGYEVPTKVGFSTIERWYYQALNEKSDPIRVLQRKVRKDFGVFKGLGEPLREQIRTQWRAHKRWSYQLHYDNLLAAANADPKLAAVPAYSTVRRYMKATGLTRQPRRGDPNKPGVQRAEERVESREVRSWEVVQPNALWHLDFHSCSRQVLTQSGERVTPHLLGILDDYSRLCCHLQWYLAETAENLVHGLGQAFAKRSMPRALMTDNGSAMTAAETTNGLSDCSVVHELTLPHSPYQNGKQESFWGQVEGRLLAMLERSKDLTLDQLNEATQAWVEMEYNRKRHDELGETPLARWLAGTDAGRPCPPSDELRVRFADRTSRRQRRSDGTISVEGVRFEIPARFRHFEAVTIRYAEWDLSHVWLWDERERRVLARIFPLDKRRNGDGQRRALADPTVQSEPEPVVEPGLPPLMNELLARYRATGLPPAYLPKTDCPAEEAP